MLPSKGPVISYSPHGCISGLSLHDSVVLNCSHKPMSSFVIESWCSLLTWFMHTSMVKAGVANQCRVKFMLSRHFVESLEKANAKDHIWNCRNLCLLLLEIWLQNHFSPSYELQLWENRRYYSQWSSWIIIWFQKGLLLMWRNKIRLDDFTMTPKKVFCPDPNELNYLASIYGWSCQT